MSVQSNIKVAFEIADDGLQGVLGYYHYVRACQSVASKADVRKSLPNSEKERPSIRITDDWVRYYQPEELCEVMDRLSSYYHIRISIISLISIFEGALQNFLQILNESDPYRSYKSRLLWAFGEAKKSQITEMGKLDQICLHVDHARRIRNLWMHNNGLLNERYGTDVISIDGCEPILFEEFEQFMTDTKPVPIILDHAYFEIVSVSHITLLHNLHDALQRTHFNRTGSYQAYSYHNEGKSIEWQRCLTGG